MKKLIITDFVLKIENVDKHEGALPSLVVHDKTSSSDRIVEIYLSDEQAVKVANMLIEGINVQLK